MKNAIFALGAVLAVVVATPALAADGQVPRTTLTILQLGDLQQMSDADGAQIRGKLVANIGAPKTQVFLFHLLSPDANNFVRGNSMNVITISAKLPKQELSQQSSVSPIQSPPPIGLEIGKLLGTVIDSLAAKGLLKIGF